MTQEPWAVSAVAGAMTAQLCLKASGHCHPHCLHHLRPLWSWGCLGFRNTDSLMNSSGRRCEGARGKGVTHSYWGVCRKLEYEEGWSHLKGVMGRQTFWSLFHLKCSLWQSGVSLVLKSPTEVDAHWLLPALVEISSLKIILLPMFIAALFTIAERWKPIQSPTPCGWMDKQNVVSTYSVSL